MEQRQTDPHDPDTPRVSQRGLSKRGAKAYQAVLEAVLCVPAGAVLGWGVDRLADTGPWGIVGGLVFGFIAFVLNTIRLPKRLNAIPDESDDGSESPAPETSESLEREDPKP